MVRVAYLDYEQFWRDNESKVSAKNPVVVEIAGSHGKAVVRVGLTCGEDRYVCRVFKGDAEEANALVTELSERLRKTVRYVKAVTYVTAEEQVDA